MIMLAHGGLHQSSHKVFDHHVIHISSQSFKDVDIKNNFLVAKNHHESILKRTIAVIL